MNPTKLSRELRTKSNPDLQRRRWIIGLSMVGMTMGQIVTLYQTGILRDLPDPPLPGLDSSRVDASDYAYKRLESPDGAIMVANYAFTTWLASMGGAKRSDDRPWMPLLMGAKLAYDAFTTVKLTQEEWQENKALCFYCQVATVASWVALGLALPEVKRSANQLIKERS